MALGFDLACPKQGHEYRGDGGVAETSRGIRGRSARSQGAIDCGSALPAQSTMLARDSMRRSRSRDIMTSAALWVMR